MSTVARFRSPARARRPSPVFPERSMPTKTPSEAKVSPDDVKTLPGGFEIEFAQRFMPGAGRRGALRLGPVARIVKNGVPVATIPIDKNGNIPENASIARLFQMEEGDRGGKLRNVFVDVAVEAKRVAPTKAKTPEDRILQYLWYLHPNELDLAKIDTPDAKWPPPQVDGKRSAAVILVGTEDEKKAVLQVINRNFTNKERQLMRGLWIEIRPSAGRGLAGYFQRARGGIEYDRIVVGRPYLTRRPDVAGPNKGNTVDDDALTHELIHFLRLRDRRRRNTVSGRASDHLTGKDRDVEEIFTDTETVARSRKSPEAKTTGYYRHIRRLPTGVSNTAEAQVHDKEILMGEKEDGKPRIRPADLREELQRERLDQGTTAGDKRLRVRLAREKGTSGAFRDVSDRDAVVEKMFKGKKGVRAYKGVEANFPNLASSTARIVGPAEVIDTYWDYRAKGTRVYTHAYSPRGTIHKPTIAREVANIGLTPGVEGVSQWKDGEKVALSRKKAK